MERYLSTSESITSNSSSSSAVSHDFAGPTLFGIISDLPILTASVVFIGFIAFLIAMEFGVKFMENWCDRKGVKSLIEKIEKELMIMGIISFLIFMFEEFSTDPIIQDHTSAKYLAFEMAHLLVLFMAFAFVLQASFLVTFSQIYGRYYINAMRTPIDKLIENYHSLFDPKDKDKYATTPSFVSRFWPTKGWLFHHQSAYIPFAPRLRADIEFRIIGRYCTISCTHTYCDIILLLTLILLTDFHLCIHPPSPPTHPPLHPSLTHPLTPTHLFIHSSTHPPTHRYFTKAHNLPQEFDFANYVNRLFMKFIAELGDVSPLSWLLLACLVAVNFLRAAVIDPRYIIFL